MVDPETLEAPFSSGATTLELATWWQRVFALIIDLAFLGLAGLVVVVVTSLVFFRSQAYPAATTGSFGVASIHPGFLSYDGVGIVIASILYFPIFDGLSQTLGKRSLGIAVRDRKTGRPVGVLRAFLRWNVYLVLWDVRPVVVELD
jgi:hypothetical protein